MSARLAYDVVIIGAGPTGFRMAQNLMGKGYRITLLEAKPNFTDRTRYVSIPLSVLPASLARADAPKALRRGRFYHSLNVSRRVDFTGDRFAALQGCYVLMSDVLVGYSREIGDVELRMSHRVRAIAQSEDEVTLSVDTPEGPREFVCQVLVSCDGVNSITNRTLGNGPRWVKMKKYHLSGVKNEPGYSELFRSHRYSTGRQLIMFNIAPGEAEIDIATTGTENLDRLFQEFIHGHRVMQERGVPEARIRPVLGGLNPIGRGELLQGRIIVVGDAAAGFPAEGGMSYGPARQSADTASGFVLKALQAKDPELLRGYVLAWDEAFGDAFRRDEQGKAAYDSLSDDEIDEVYRTYSGDDIKQGLLEFSHQKAQERAA